MDAAREFKAAGGKPIECVFRAVAATETGFELDLVEAPAPAPIAVSAPVGAEQASPSSPQQQCTIHIGGLDTFTAPYMQVHKHPPTKMPFPGMFLSDGL